MTPDIERLAKEAVLSEIIDEAYTARGDWLPFIAKFSALVADDLAKDLDGCLYDAVGERIDIGAAIRAKYPMPAKHDAV